MLTYLPVVAPQVALLGVSYAYSAGPSATSLILPAMVGQVQVLLSGSWSAVDGMGNRHRPPKVVLVGPTNRTSHLCLEAGTSIIGTGITPAGWQTLVGAPAEQLADATIDAASVWGDRAVSALLGGLQLGHCNETAAASLGSALLEAVPKRPVIDRGRLDCIGGWLECAGETSLDTLATRLDLSHRQTARLTSDWFGGTPKLLQMKYRALRTAVEIGLTANTGTIASTASVDQFYDESHLIRDFKRFVGSTPSVFKRDHAAFSKRMLAGRWRAGARTALSLWS